MRAIGRPSACSNADRCAAHPSLGETGPMSEILWVADPQSLQSLIDDLSGAGSYALDTEFLTERTYWPRLALLQVAWAGGIAIVDPFAVDVAPFGAILGGGGTMVAHAADQDLAILERACGCGPTSLFDTQVAAGFCGYGTPSLATLVDKVLGTRLAKGDRLTDWTHRPLSAGERAYAAADVEHLLALRERLTAELDAAGRLTWALDECEERRARDRTRRDAEAAWWRMKGSRQMRGKSRGVAQKLAAWRERTAAAADLPPRFVLPDLALVGIVQRPPRTAEQLQAVRGLDGRHLRNGAAAEILSAIEEGLSLDPTDLRLPDAAPIDRSLGAAVTVVAAWLAQRASELDLDPALLATRFDISLLLSGVQSRVSTGWRAELVGEPINRLMRGDAVLALADRGRRLILEDRCR